MEIRRQRTSTTKAAKKELEKDNDLLAELVIAEKLGKTLNELRENVSAEEINLWLLFYDIRAEEEKRQRDMAKRRRR